MKLSAAVANFAWLAASIPAWQRFKRALRAPREAQLGILRRLLRKNAATVFGKLHGFSAIQDYPQFRRRVPVMESDRLAMWVERIGCGERSVLTASPVTRLVPTSGSSGGRKLVPFTAEFQREFNAAIGPWMCDLARQHPSIALGPAYWSISPAFCDVSEAARAVPIGFDDDSAYLGGARQTLVELAFAVPSALRLLGDLETFRYATLLCLLRQPELRLISVWHPSFLTLLLECLREHWEFLLDDLATGDCRCLARLPSQVATVLTAKPQRARADALRLVGADVRLIWPHLSVVSCWADAQAESPFLYLRRHLPGIAFQPKGLLATEGVVSIPYRGRHPVAVSSHFYEFVDRSGSVHLVDELQSGEVYSILLTNSAGLWRYQLGDEVVVDGFVDATPSLRFVGRGNQVSDLCGEKLHEEFVTRAVREVLDGFGVTPPFWILAPEAPDNDLQRYTLFIEGRLTAEARERLDSALRHNPHYAHCQNLGQLGALEICPVGPGGYETLARRQSCNGQRLGDFKPQSLSRRLDLRRCLAPDLGILRGVDPSQLGGAARRIESVSATEG